MMRFLRSRTLQTAICRGHSPSILSIRNIQFSRRLASTDGSFDPEKAEKIAQTAVFRKIAESSKAMEEMRKTMDLMVSEGYIKPGETPSVFTQMRMMANSKLRQQLMAMKDAFDEAGIEVTKDDANQLLSIMMFNQDDVKKND